MVRLGLARPIATYPSLELDGQQEVKL
jgi:hypothetical protein